MSIGRMRMKEDKGNREGRVSQAKREGQGEMERENRHLFVDFGEMHVEDEHKYIKKNVSKDELKSCPHFWLPPWAFSERKSLL